MSISRVARMTVGSALLLLATVGCSGAGDDVAAPGGDSTPTTAAPDVSSLPVDPAFCAALAGSPAALAATGAIEANAADQLVATLDQVRSTAPAALAADVEIISATLAQIAPMLTGSTLPADLSQLDPEDADAMAAQMSALGAQYRAIEDPRFQTAMARINAYTEQKCG